MTNLTKIETDQERPWRYVFVDEEGKTGELLPKRPLKIGNCYIINVDGQTYIQTLLNNLQRDFELYAQVDAYTSKKVNKGYEITFYNTIKGEEW